MSKGVFLGVGDKARKVKKMFTGVDDAARKVKKGFIGVGGVARLFFSGGELAYSGPAPALDEAAYFFPAFRLGGNAVFYTGSTLNVYSEDLVKTERPVSRHFSDAGSNGTFAVFADLDASIALDSDFVETELTPLPIEQEEAWGDLMNYLGGRTPLCIGQGVFFAGGKTEFLDAYNDSRYVVGYDKNYTLKKLENMTEGDWRCASGRIGNYGLVIGNGKGRFADAYADNYIKTSIAAPEGDHYDAKTAPVEDMLLVAGGYGKHKNGNDACTIVDAYTPSLVHSVVTPLDDERFLLTGTAIADVAVFMGGAISDTTDPMQGVSKSTSLVYDNTGAWSYGPDMSRSRHAHGAVVVGGYLLVGGGISTPPGDSYGTPTDAVDVFIYD